MITAMSLTNGTLTVIRDNGAEILTARNDHPRWNELVEAFKNKNEERLATLLSLKAVVEEYSVGQLTINATGVLYHGQPVHTLDADRVMAFLRDGLPYKPLANYMAKLGNVSPRVKAELYKFLEHKNMPITDEGKIIAYKGVELDFFSVMGNTSTVVLEGEVNSGGHIKNVVGATIRIERSSCDDDYRNGCSFGLHAGSLSYAKGWGRRVILVEIDPADVVSVPEDCNCQKLRCCGYRVLGEYTGPMPHAYTPEFSSTAPTANGECPGCNNPSEDCDCEEECGNCGEVQSNCTCEDECTGCYNPESECTCGQSCSCGQSGCPDCDAGINAPEPVDLPAPAPETVPPVELPNGEREGIETRARNIIAEQLAVDPASITSATLLNDLGMDSLDAVELVMAFEEEFNQEVSDEDAETIGVKPFSAIVDYIYHRVSPVTVPEPAPAQPVDAAYMRGMQQGVSDRARGVTAQYLAGDQAGADSEDHAKFIDGYVNGFAS